MMATYTARDRATTERLEILAGIRGSSDDAAVRKGEIQDLLNDRFAEEQKKTIEALGLGDSATLSISDDLDFTVDPESLATRETIGAYLDLIKPQLIAEWEHSANVNVIDFTNIDDWECIRIEIYNLMTTDVSPVVQVSFDNGITFPTSGYYSAVTDAGGNATSSSAFIIARNSGDLDGHIDLSGLSERCILSGVTRRDGRAMMFAGKSGLGAVNACRIAMSAPATGGKIKLYGMVRR